VSVPGWLRWTLLALLGLAVAAGVSVAASHLVSQRIGLASEPLSAGKELAPPPRERPNDRHASDSRTTTPATTTTTTTTTTTGPPGPATTSPPPATAPASPSPTGPAPRAPAEPAAPSDGAGEHHPGDD